VTRSEPQQCSGPVQRAASEVRNQPVRLEALSLLSVVEIQQGIDDDSVEHSLA
jgi:hypothetical protein